MIALHLRVGGGGGDGGVGVFDKRYNHTSAEPDTHSHTHTHHVVSFSHADTLTDSHVVSPTEPIGTLVISSLTFSEGHVLRSSVSAGGLR